MGAGVLLLSLARLCRVFRVGFCRLFVTVDDPLPLQYALRYGVEEGQDYPKPDEDVQDGEDLAHGRRRVEVTVANGSKRYNAEVQRVEQAPTFGVPVEEGPGEQRQEREEEEPPELGVFPGAPNDSGEPDQGCQERYHRDLRDDARD